MSGNTKQSGNIRDDIRASIFGAKPETRTIEFFGHEIELRQPTLGATMEMRRSTDEDATANMLINYAYVPGTNDHVFEAADEENIKNIPFGADMQRLSQAVNELVGVTPADMEKMLKDATKSAGEGSAEADGDVDSGGTAQDGGGDRALATV